MRPAQVKFNREGTPQLPKKLPEVVDLLYATEQERFALQHKVDRLKSIESACEQALIDRIDLKEAKGATGRVASVEIEVKRVPVAVDWDKLLRHVRKTGEFEFLQRRLSTKAVEERWEAGKAVPGTGVLNVKTVHLRKLKKRG